MTHRPKLLITGAGGQLGVALQRAHWSDRLNVVALRRDQLDIASSDQVEAAVGAGGFAAVINAAAFTAVDKAENAAAETFAVNCRGAENIAKACARHGAVMVHVSTDYVFDGAKAAAYVEGDAIAPINTYGRSKAAGEAAIRENLRQHIILRTAWLFGPRHPNFVRTILRLAREKDELRVVSDQYGNPTSAQDLADGIVKLMERLLLRDGVNEGTPWGTYHCVNDGVASWHELADAAVSQANGRLGKRTPVRPITTADYPTPAPRPANSELDCGKLQAFFGIRMRPWREALLPVVNDILAEA